MVFSSLLFMFGFLPVTAILYHVSGRQLKNLILLTASLFFYAWGEPVYVVLMCVSIMINFRVATFIGREGVSAQRKKFYLVLGLVFNLACLAYFKYFGMIISTIAGLANWSWNVGTPALPIGISFFTFQALSYVIDVYRGNVKPQRSIATFSLYIAMFPQLIAGPIVNYVDIENQLAERSMTFKKFYSGLRRFLCGMGKKVLLANNISVVWSEVKEMPAAEISVLMAWAGIIAFALQIYFDFSGYSDMAIGLGEMFGFRFKENFRYPYISQSVSEFWRRWHISLGTWFKNYVYIPLGGNRVGRWRYIRNLFIVWFLTGMWHGASWNFVLWGLYFGSLLLMENLFLQKIMARWPQTIRHIYLLLSVVVGWVLFEFSNLTDIVNFFRLMFGMGDNLLVDSQALVQLKSYAILYAGCIIGASPWPKRWALLFRKNHASIYSAAVNAYYCALTFFLTAHLVGSTHNPFIYFRF